MNILEQIHQGNWNTAQFHTEGMRAFISLGAAPAPEDSAQNTPVIEYLVTVTDNDFQEIFQSTHLDLSMALSELNKKYGHWNLKDADDKNAGDGCSSCAAH